MANRGPVNHLVTEIQPVDISVDVNAFRNAIQSQGVNLVHYKAFRCPVGMTDINDNQRVHEDHAGCQGGFVFTKAGTVLALFSYNTKNKNSDDVGFWDGSTVQVTFGTKYNDSEKNVVVAPFDQFYLDEESITVPMWQLFIHSETGKDRLKYPVVEVEDLIDNRGERYSVDCDFVVRSGQIEWIGSRRPAPSLNVGPQPSIDRGAVCSVRYTYRPFWRVGRILHEIRVTQTQNIVTGERKLERMPQGVVLHREYVSLDKQQDSAELTLSGVAPTSSDFLKQILGPMNGSFGPR